MTPDKRALTAEAMMIELYRLGVPGVTVDGAV